MSDRLFRDRRDAGRTLAGLLDHYRDHRYVRGRSEDADAEESLRGFERFPTWMWRGTAVLDSVGWLREHNDGTTDERGRSESSTARAVEPLERTAGWERGEVPETYPFTV